VFAIIVLILITRLPESPRWLLSKDRQEEAAVVLASLASKPVNDEEVALQAGVIMDGIRASGQVGEKTPVSACFTNGKSQHLRRMLLGGGSQMMQQLSGMRISCARSNSTEPKADIILQDATLSSTTSRVCSKTPST